MATFIDYQRISTVQGEDRAHEYATLTGTVTRSGNTVTLSNLVCNIKILYLIQCSGYSNEYYITTSASDTAKLSTTGVKTWDFSISASERPYSEDLSMGNMSFSVAASDTSKTFYLRCTSLEYDQIPFTVTFESGETAPTTPTVSATSVAESSITMSYGTTSFGNPNSGTITLYGSTRAYPISTVLASEQTTGTSSYIWSSLTPNTRYYTKAVAENTAGLSTVSSVYGTVTLPPTASLSYIGLSGTTASFTYSTPNQGGAYDMILKYQLDSGNSVTVDTLTGSGIKTGTFDISNLSLGQHTITISLTTAAGEVVSNTVTFTVTEPGPKLYGPVLGVTGVNPTTPSAAVSSIDSNDFEEALNTWMASNQRRFTTGSRPYQFIIRRQTSTTQVVLSLKQEGSSIYPETILYQDTASSLADLRQYLASWGISCSTASTTWTATITINGTYGNIAKQVKKLYGSVAGQTMTVSNWSDPDGMNVTVSDNAKLLTAIKNALPSGVDVTDITGLRISVLPM